MTPDTPSPESSVKHDRGRRTLLGALVLTAIVSNLPVLRHLLYPFRLFTTWVHEMSHGVAAMLCGGDFLSLVVNPDSSGLAVHAGVSGSLARGFVASAGYLGAALFGVLLLSSRVSRPAARAVLLGLGGAMLLSVLLWIRNPFGVLSCAALGLGFLGLALKVKERWHPAFLAYLGAQTCLEGLLDIRALYSVTERSDAVTLSELFWFPPWVWATLWLLASLTALAFALRWLPTRAKRETRPAGDGMMPP